MKHQKAFRIAAAMLTCALAAALCGTVIWLYADGLREREALQSELAPLFTREKTGSALRQLWPLALLWLCAVVGVVLSGKGGESRQRKHPSPSACPPPSPRMDPNRRFALRITLLSAAVLLILLGVLDGGLRDVLEKAVHICTECIGLG